MTLKREVARSRDELEHSLNIKMEKQTEIIITQMREMINDKRNRFEEMNVDVERDNELDETKMVNRIRMHSDNTNQGQKFKDEKVDFALKKQKPRQPADISKK